MEERKRSGPYRSLVDFLRRTGVVDDTSRATVGRHAHDVGIEADDARLRPALSEVERLFSDSSKMRALTGWSPEHAGRDGFARGLEKTVAWFRDPANLAAYRPGEYVL